MSLLGYIVVLFLDKLEDLCCGPSPKAACGSFSLSTNLKL